MTDKIIVRKGRDGWMAQSDFPMPEIGDGRVLQINTAKGDRGIYSAASIHVHREGIVTFVIYGDYRRVLERNKETRCTEKTIAEMHARSLALLDTLKAEAVAFYQTKALKEAA